MVHRFVLSCFTSDVGRLAHQSCCHEPLCTLLRLQRISSMFVVCGLPPPLLMNGACSSKCRPKLSQGTLVRFRKIGRHLFWRFSSLLEDPLSRASPHNARLARLASPAFKGSAAHIAPGRLKAKARVATACQPLALPFIP